MRQPMVSGAPLTPDADQAQQWAESELSKAKYNDSPGLLERIVNWLFDRLADIIPAFDGSSTFMRFVVITIVIALVALAVFLLARLGSRGRTQRGAVKQSLQPLFDDVRTSKELFASADDAVRRGDKNLAVVERYRGVIRLLDERGYIVVRPGMTAYEAAVEGTTVSKAGHLFYPSAQWFNGIYYSDAQANDEALGVTRALQETMSKLPARARIAADDLVRS